MLKEDLKKFFPVCAKLENRQFRQNSINRFSVVKKSFFPKKV